MKKVDKKRIKVITNSPIRAKGWVYGPILNPYVENVKVIFAMLSEGHKIIEVLPNGEEIQLDSRNFDKDNTSIAMVRQTSKPVVADTVVYPENDNKSFNKKRQPLEVAPAIEIEDTAVVISSDADQVDTTAEEVVEEVTVNEEVRKEKKQK